MRSPDHDRGDAAGAGDNRGRQRSQLHDWVPRQGRARQAPLPTLPASAAGMIIDRRPAVDADPERAARRWRARGHELQLRAFKLEGEVGSRQRSARRRRTGCRRAFSADQVLAALHRPIVHRVHAGHQDRRHTRS